MNLESALTLAVVIAVLTCPEGAREQVHPCRGGSWELPVTCRASEDLAGGGLRHRECRDYPLRCGPDGGLTETSRQYLCGLACADECADAGLADLRMGPALDCARACTGRRRCFVGN